MSTQILGGRCFYCFRIVAKETEVWMEPVVIQAHTTDDEGLGLPTRARVSFGINLHLHPEAGALF